VPQSQKKWRGLNLWDKVVSAPLEGESAPHSEERSHIGGRAEKGAAFNLRGISQTARDDDYQGRQHFRHQ